MKKLIRRINKKNKSLFYIVLFVSLICLFFFSSCVNNQDPKFKFEFEDELVSGVHKYEITKELIEEGIDLLNININIVCDYNKQPDTSPIEVNIVAKDKPENPFFYGYWEDTKKDYVISLTSEELRMFGLFDKNGDLEVSNQNREFFIRLISDEFQQIDSDIFEIINTPWVHYVQLSDSAITEEDEVIAYVFVKNYGSPSEFQVRGFLYDSTLSDITKIKQKLENVEIEEFNPEIIWTKINKENTINDPQEEGLSIKGNGEAIFKLDLKDFTFIEEHTYILEIFAVKNLPYVDFGEDDWLTAAESIRLRNQPSYMTIAVLSRKNNDE